MLSLPEMSASCDQSESITRGSHARVKDREVGLHRGSDSGIGNIEALAVGRLESDVAGKDRDCRGLEAGWPVKGHGDGSASSGADGDKGRVKVDGRSAVDEDGGAKVRLDAVLTRGAAPGLAKEERREGRGC